MPCSCWISSDVTIWAFRAPVILVLAVSGCCTPHTTHRNVHSVHHAPYTTHHTPHTIHHTPYTTHHTPHTIHHTPHTIHHTPHTIHHTPYTTHHTSHTIHHTPYITHYTPHTTHYTPYTSTILYTCTVRRCRGSLLQYQITQNIIEDSCKGNNLVCILMLIPLCTLVDQHCHPRGYYCDHCEREEEAREGYQRRGVRCSDPTASVYSTHPLSRTYVHTQHLPKFYTHTTHTYSLYQKQCQRSISS